MKEPSSTYICLPLSPPLRPSRPAPLRSDSRQARLSPFSSSSKMAADKWLAGRPTGPLILGPRGPLPGTILSTGDGDSAGPARLLVRTYRTLSLVLSHPLSSSLSLSFSRSRSIRKSSPRVPFSSAARTWGDRGCTAYLRRKLGRASDPRVARAQSMTSRRRGRRDGDVARHIRPHTYTYTSVRSGPASGAASPAEAGHRGFSSLAPNYYLALQ